MEQISKTFINTRKIAEIFFYLFVFSLFFPVRYVFITSTTFKTGVFSDFTSISFYLSDILLFITWFWLILPRGGSLPRDILTSPRGRINSFLSKFGLYIKNFTIIPNSYFLILILWLILATIWQIHSFSSLNAYFLLKFLELIVAYGTIRLLFQETSSAPRTGAGATGTGVKLRFFKLFAALGTVQAGLVLGQFFLQHPLGLFKLGEQQIFTWNQGIAKLIVNGETFVRGYGTFPHPNPLSAYLITTIFILVYLFLQSGATRKKILYTLMTVMSVFGLIATFSRASFLALGIGAVGFFGYFLIKRASKLNFVPLGTMLVSLLAAFLIFQPFLLTRATVSDSASLQRIFYAKVGWQIIRANPVFGAGIGESVLHMQQFSNIKLWPWQIQPVHNYFELSAAEFGIPGALILIWILLWHGWKLFQTLIPNSYFIIQSKDGSNLLYRLTLIGILICFLLLMQFDHYFYTLQQTQLMLWIILGAIAAEIKKPSPEEEKGREEVNS